MRGPAVNLVMLGMVVLAVWLHYHARPQMRNRLWLTGWVAAFLSTVVWELTFARPAMERLRDTVRFDFILLAQLLFVISLVAPSQRLWRVMWVGSAIGVSVVVVFNAYLITNRWIVAVALGVAVWQIYGVYGMRRLISKSWRIRRLLILAICVVYGTVFAVHLAVAAHPDLQDWTLAELALCSAVLYGADEERRSVPNIVGTAGFLLWAAFYLLDSGTELALLPGRLHWVGVFWDIPKFMVAWSMLFQMTEEARREKEHLADRYRELYEDFRLVYERNPHPMWIYDESTSRFVSANRAAQNAYGYSESEWRSMDVRELLAGPEELPPGQDPAPASPAAIVLGEPVRLRHRLKDQRTITVDVTEHRILFQGESARFVMAVDVTELERESRELLYRANHDALTGLPNRRQLDERIDACLERSLLEQRKALLLAIDVDHFKQVNDTYGHIVGDECLKAIAARLQSRIRQVDTLARTGGEEFTAIIGGLSSAEDAPRIAATLLTVFSTPLALSIGELHITISVGGAVYPDDGTDRETLRRRSDEALYAAKHQGRDRAVFAPHPSAAVTMELSPAK